MNSFGTRARSTELAQALDRSLAGTGSTAIAGGAVGREVAVATRLSAVGAELAAATLPRTEFRAALRTRLVAVASVQAVNAPTASVPSPLAGRAPAVDSAVSWYQSRRGQRGIGVAAGAMASVIVVAGVAVAGSQSLPGDPFYSVKRGAEALELTTTSGPVAKGTKQLEFAAERLKEVRGLALGRDSAFSGDPSQPVALAAFGGSVSARMVATLADMDRETRTGSGLLTAAYRATSAEAPLQILSRFASRQTRDLQSLLPDLPARARSRGESSLALVSQVAVDTSQLLAVGVCTSQCAPSQAAPALPPMVGPDPQPAPAASTGTPCGCQPATAPAPLPGLTPAPQPSTLSTPAPAPHPGPSSPAPSRSPTPQPSSTPFPVATPSLPVPVPSLPPLPVPTITPTALPAVPGLVHPVASALALP